MRRERLDDRVRVYDLYVVHTQVQGLRPAQGHQGQHVLGHARVQAMTLDQVEDVLVAQPGGGEEGRRRLAEKVEVRA